MSILQVNAGFTVSQFSGNRNENCAQLSLGFERGEFEGGGDRSNDVQVVCNERISGVIRREQNFNSAEAAVEIPVFRVRLRRQSQELRLRGQSQELRLRIQSQELRLRMQSQELRLRRQSQFQTIPPIVRLRPGHHNSISIIFGTIL
ncbi:hypothetical protein AVEN_273613-1 [Araneus ventricosus]|uniref:Uncharacterized protein n=1 Tax=Araneus ventricosus TaxID=182803 RepID=A0A4Y2JWN3_ARAVE|nr:hypothetical protein AVEN_273613-1 [Araneus ventricosus]